MHRPTRPPPQARAGFENVLDILVPVNIAIILGHFGEGVKHCSGRRPCRPCDTAGLFTQLPLHKVADDMVGHLVKLLYLVGHFGRGFEAHVAQWGEFAS